MFIIQRELVNQANDPIPLTLTTEVKKVNIVKKVKKLIIIDIEVNDVNNLNSTNVSVSEISSQNHPNPTTRFNKPSYPNTQTPKHLVPCPFLRRKRHCVKGSKCVDSHRPLQFGPRVSHLLFGNQVHIPALCFHLRFLTHPLMNHLYTCSLSYNPYKPCNP